MLLGLLTKFNLFE